MEDMLTDTHGKAKRRRKRREKFKHKRVKGLNVNLTRADKLTKRQATLLVTKMGTERALADIQHRSPIIWVKRNISTEKGTDMEFKNRPYLVDIYKDFSQHIVVKKGSQIGLTQLSVAKSLYVADNHNMTIIYTFPTVTHVRDFSKTRFSSIISQSPYLSSRIRNFSSQQLIEVGKGTILFRGTINDKQAISTPSDLNIHDELDFSSPDVRDIFSSRLSVSDYKWEWDFSTPTLPDAGIDALYKESDKHVWKVKCKGCNKWQQIYYFNNLRVRKKHGGEKRFFFGCIKCDKPLDRRNGQYVALKPGREIRGYFIPQEACPVISAKYMRDEYRKAKKRPGGMKKFWNFNLGRAFESGESRLRISTIKNNVVPGTITKGKIAIGSDQGDILHVVVSKITDKRRYVEITTLDSIPQLLAMIKHYERDNEVICVLDAYPNHNEATRYAAVVPNLFLCYYETYGILNLETLKDRLENKEVHVPRTDLLDFTAQEWHDKEVLIESYINNKDIQEFAIQMKNMKRDLVEDKRRGGKMRPVWVATGADHYRHADAYNWIAAELYKGKFSHTMVVEKTVNNPFSSEDLFEFEPQEAFAV